MSLFVLPKEIRLQIWALVYFNEDPRAVAIEPKPHPRSPWPQLCLPSSPTPAPIIVNLCRESRAEARYLAHKLGHLIKLSADDNVHAQYIEGAEINKVPDEVYLRLGIDIPLISKSSLWALQPRWSVNLRRMNAVYDDVTGALGFPHLVEDCDMSIFRTIGVDVALDTKTSQAIAREICQLWETTRVILVISNFNSLLNEDKYRIVYKATRVKELVDRFQRAETRSMMLRGLPSPPPVTLEYATLQGANLKMLNIETGWSYDLLSHNLLDQNLKRELFRDPGLIG